MEKTASIETNLDDLIVALTDETAPFVQSKEKLYRTVAFMLTRLLNAAPCRQQPRQTAPNLLDQTRDSVRVIEK